jgi:hypothetical protein
MTRRSAPTRCAIRSRIGTVSRIDVRALRSSPRSRARVVIPAIWRYASSGHASCSSLLASGGITGVVSGRDLRSGRPTPAGYRAGRQSGHRHAGITEIQTFVVKAGAFLHGAFGRRRFCCWKFFSCLGRSGTGPGLRVPAASCVWPRPRLAPATFGHHCETSRLSRRAGSCSRELRSGGGILRLINLGDRRRPITLADAPDRLPLREAAGGRSQRGPRQQR